MALTCAILTESFVKAEEMFMDSAKNQDYKANVVAANAIVENTTAKVDVVNDDQKKRVAKIYWNSLCAPTVITTTPDYCDFGGDKPNSECKTYEILKKASSEFSIDEADYKNSNLDFALAYADSLMKTMKAVDEKIAQVVVSTIDSFSSVNKFEGGIGCSDATGLFATTFIEPSLWTPDVIGYFIQAGIMNKFANPFLLDGSNLFQHAWKATQNAGNADGKGAKTMFDQIKYYSDLFNVEAVSPKKTFMIDRGAVAFAARPIWEGFSATSPKKGAGDLYKYSEKSKNITGLTYDIYVKETCSNEYSKYDVLVVANYDIFNGPSSCDSATGVIEFKCGACPVIV